MSGRGFLSRIFGRGTDEDETRLYPFEEIGERMAGKEEPKEEQPRGFTIQRAVEIIDDLPPDVPQESALRIVRGTLAAIGVEIEDIERSTRARETRLSSEIELARSRQKDLRERTEEVVRSLEEEMRKAREACNTGIAEEEERASLASASLEEVRRVRAFFGFPQTEEVSNLADDPSDDTQVLEPFDEDGGRAVRRPGFLADKSEDSPKPGASYDTTDER